MLFRVRAALIMLLIPCVVLVTATGCAKKKAKPEVRVASSGANGFGANGAWGPDGAPGAFGVNGTGSMAGGGGAFDSTGSLMNTGNTSGVENGAFTSELEMIHFEYDSSDISDSWRQVLDGHAQWINNNARVMVQIQGHCDERGTEEYNVALGQKRADAVREYLVERGVDANRLSTISYGKMRPLSFEQAEQAHSLNRRAMFLVYETGGTSVASAN